MNRQRRRLYEILDSRLYYWFGPPAEYPPEFSDALRVQQVQAVFDRYEQRGGSVRWLHALLWQLWHGEPEPSNDDIDNYFNLVCEVQRLVAQVEALARRHSAKNVIVARRALQEELTTLEGPIRTLWRPRGRPNKGRKVNRVNRALALLAYELRISNRFQWQDMLLLVRAVNVREFLPPTTSADHLRQRVLSVPAETVESLRSMHHPQP
jgi:hypothetical protein